MTLHLKPWRVAAVRRSLSVGSVNMKLEEIAQLAGVSRTTASYVINGKARQYRVSEMTIERVLSVVREFNYQPNAVATGLRVGKTRSFGVIIPDLENSSYTLIAKYLERQARSHGYQLLIACSEDDPQTEMNCAQHLLQRQVDALIVSTVLPAGHGFYERWVNNALPIVGYDRHLDPALFKSIVGDDYQDARKLAQSLQRFPVKNILFFGAQPNLSVSQLREQGFRQSFSQGTYQVEYLYCLQFDQHAATEQFANWLQTHPLPDAIFTTSFRLLQGVLAVCRDKFRQIPSNLHLATFGCNDVLSFLNCPVLTINQQHQQVAAEILSIIINALEERTNPIPSITRIPRILSI